jgi:hypothetical protein
MVTGTLEIFSNPIPFFKVEIDERTGLKKIVLKKIRKTLFTGFLGYFLRLYLFFTY